MPVFYFDIQIGSDPPSQDEDGEDLADIEAARVEAGIALCSLARDMLKAGQTPDLYIQVRDAFGKILCVELNFRIMRLN